jgi:Fe-coproporphyrin III synthase
MMQLALKDTFKRYRTLNTHKIGSLPIVILMPHSGCNCRCVMCDIWKGNANRKQLTKADITGLISSFQKLGTKQVVMSGGEALLNQHFFKFCALLNVVNIKVTLLSTGLLLKKNAADIIRYVSNVIVSLDGDECTHDAIRNTDGAFRKLKEGVQYLKLLKPSMRITGRSVIQKLNFRNWAGIVDAAKDIGLDSISFLPADISSSAFNREMPWDNDHTSAVAIPREELPVLKEVINSLTVDYRSEFETRFIVESPAKLKQIYQYYSAVYGLNEFPAKKCNAPWVSAVVEADGSVKPCFFHNAIGNIRDGSLVEILNDETGLNFRKSLDMEKDETCKRCVCSLNLPFYKNPA